MQTTHYEEQFYHQYRDGSLRTARLFMSYLFARWKPNSVVDLGCGRGAWLAACHELGVQKVVGLDGPWVERESLIDSAIDFHTTNLEQPLTTAERYDLVLSLEVAEHLQPDTSDAFVESLTQLADAIVFSAAFSAQPGTNHVNTRLHSFWASKLQAKGFVLFDFFRPEFWSDERVDPWYKQNAFLYVRPEHPLYRILVSAGFRVFTDGRFADAIHPWLYFSALKEMARLQAELAKRN